ncbi:bromodomain adjacent to zinc finger domain protein 2B-like [Pomacea canaliculata]|uniref:bromodomain adjacent to zinc finger domain protein 2B-like n=1 Tax=Pomacea canaliculata TaxID=400727 RepID=UPI000D729382|nr:bromodomain adjacent to zinc finger domain protein 2B-like [Pomacea canaliculata]
MMSLFLLLVPALLCHVVVSGQTLQSPVPVEGEIEPSNTTSIDDLSFAGVRNENEDNSSVPENLSTDAVRSVTTTSDTFSSDVDNEETPERVDGIGKHRVPTLKSLIARVQQRVTTYPILYQGLKKGREGRDSLNEEEGLRGASGSRTWFEKNPKVTITVDAQGYPHRIGAKVRSRVTDHQQSNQGGDAVLAIGRSGNGGLFAEQHAPYTSSRTSNNQLPDSNGYSGYSGKNSMNSNYGAGARQRTRDYPAASDISLLFSKLSQIENELLGLKETVLLQGSVHIRTSQRLEALIVNQIKLALQNSRTSTQILEKLNSCCGCTAPGKESADLSPDSPLSRRASMPDQTGTSFVSNGTQPSNSSSAIRNVTEVDDTLRESRSDVKETNGRQNQTFVVNATSERATSSGPSTMVRKVVDVPIEAMPSNTTPTTTLSKMAVTSPTPISEATATSVVSTAKSHRENGEEVTDDERKPRKQADEEILAKKLHDPGDEDSESDEEDESDEDSSDDDDNEEDENQSKYRRKEPHGADSDDDDDEDDDDSDKEEKEADDSDKTKMDRHGESDENSENWRKSEILNIRRTEARARTTNFIRQRKKGSLKQEKHNDQLLWEK